MQHYVGAISNYFTLEAVHGVWAEFQAQVDGADNIDRLQEVLAEHLRVLHFRYARVLGKGRWVGLVTSPG